ncbi:MAG: glucuronyl hydrolase, partial [Flavobacteriaceae bacterium]
MKIINLSLFILCTLLFSACTPTPPDTPAEFVDKQFKNADTQLSLLLTDALAANRNPRTIDAEGEYHWVRQGFDWTEGFFPGTSWFLFDITKNDKWKASAEKFQATYQDHKYLTGFHDLGFIFNCSYGNGYKSTKNEAFKDVLITASDSLITRFNPTVGSIMSWDVDHGWQSERGWKFPVIIDNMMNLEMLFEASIITGDSKYKDVAIAHADTTLKNHFREDYSCYHVVDYDPETGAVR